MIKMSLSRHYQHLYPFLSFKIILKIFNNSPKDGSSQSFLVTPQRIGGG